MVIEKGKSEEIQAKTCQNKVLEYPGRGYFTVTYTESLEKPAQTPAENPAQKWTLCSLLWFDKPFKGGEDPHPQDFSLTKKTARFTKGQFRPY